MGRHGVRTESNAMSLTLGVLLGVLAVAAAVAYRRRLAGFGEPERLTDEAIQRIEQEGRLEVDDEPLDLDTIRDEESRFWEETWDEPEEL